MSPEDEAALKEKGKDLKPKFSEETHARPESVETEAFMALHRKRPDQGFSPKTEEEIRRKREELIEKLQKKKGSS